MLMPFGPALSETGDGIKIHGWPDFLLQSKQSLELLQPIAQFKVIQANIAIIRQGNRSGMRAWAKNPTFIVGRRSWEHSVLGYASAIAHDAYHSKLYREAKIVCATLTLDGLAHEYEVKRTPEAVARAYSDTYDVTLRGAVYEGCKAGVTK